MKCPNCGYENREGAKFCRECAVPLAGVISCPKCGTPSEGGQKFCDSCGQRLAEPAHGSPVPDPRSYTPKHLAEKILTSRSALEGERKQVTVLFADVKGSMELAEQVDPEEWHRIMDRFFAILSEGVHRFEGTINQFTGDGVMALFGAPIAHEDHARRACYAALHLQNALRRHAQDLRREKGFDFAVRMGLNSGDVVVGRIGDDLRMDYTAQGHTVGLAARMEQIAAADRTYLTKHTAALVSGFFQLEDLGLFHLKGVRESIRAYELQGIGPLRTRLDVSRTRGFSRFVGREAEMTSLEAALARALEGNGQVVGVVGEAGLGKSRLCFEFLERCRARGVAVYEAHCVSHGTMIPFLPVLELLRGYFGISEQDGDETARRKIAGTLLLLDKELTEELPLLLDFLGVPDPQHPAPRVDPESRQRLLLDLVKRLIHARSRREPAVIVFEDLHWIDGGSEAFIEAGVDGLPGTRTLFLLNFRPEYHAGWMQKSYYQQLPLMPLGPGAIGEMLGDLLGSDPSLDGLPERIRERTAGNPFFIEEVVQALAEAGGLEGSRGGYRLVRPVEEAAIPATVQAVLASRIDRLGEREKTALQTAAVIGKEFGEPVLRRVAGIPEAELAAALRALIAAEFVYEEQLYPEAAYVFKHPLTQEVAYRAQLAEHRARLHAAVAQVIEELHPEKLDEKAALLAHHWEAAGQALDAARWHERAARWAALNNPREAQRHSQRVRELVKTLPESPERGALHVAACTQLLNLAMHLGTSAEEASVIRAEGKAVAERSGDLFGLAGLAVAYVWADISAAFEPDALEPSREAARLAEQTGDLDLRVTASCGLAFAQMFVGNCREALALTERAIELSSKESTLGLSTLSFSSYLWLVWFRGQLLVRMGRLTEAAPALGHASELARELGDVRMTGFTHNWLCQLSCYAGDAAAALGHARRGLEIAEKIASPFSRVIALLNIGRARLVGEEWHEAAAATEEALALARERRTALQVEMLLLADLAVARLGCGEGRAGLAAAEEALAIARRRAAKTHEIEVRLALARALIHTEGLEARGAVEAELSEASALIETTGQRAVEPYVHVERAELARLAGDEDGRRRELREAHRLFTAMGATGHAERLAKEALG